MLKVNVSQPLTTPFPLNIIETNLFNKMIMWSPHHEITARFLAQGHLPNDLKK